jgi:hypothetical protein
MKPEHNEATAAESHTGQLPLEAGVTPRAANVSLVQLESENSRLQNLVAELLVRNQQLREELKSASRSEIRHPSGPLDSVPAPLTYNTDNFSTRIVTARLRT